MDLSAYANRWSVEPGDAVRLAVSTDSDAYEVDIIRHGGEDEMLPTAVSGSHSGRGQSIHPGSYATVPDSPLLRELRSFTIQMWIWPTTPGRNEPQGLLTRWSGSERRGFGLFVDGDRGVSLWLAGADGETLSVATRRPLDARVWCFVAACYDADDGRVTLHQTPLDNRISDPASITNDSIPPVRPADHAGPLLIAAGGDPRGDVPKRGAGYLYNGKIDSPRLFGRALGDDEIVLLGTGMPAGDIRGLVAGWNFAEGIPTQKIRDVSGHGLHGDLVNMPARAMTGHNWDGTHLDFSKVPEQWGAIHFHDDDLEDAGWETDFEFHVPDDFRSGVYSVALTAGSTDWHLPLFVEPGRNAERADIAFLVPTLTYLAYANHSYAPGHEAEVVRTMTLLDEVDLDSRDEYLADHPELGLSLYATHSDGSGVCYTSRLRPVPNLHPEYCWWGSAAPRHLSADLDLVRWLEHENYRYDIITDESLHSEGTRLLSHYRVVLTGSHPEYWTAPMLDGLSRYLAQGGRLMYLGGNGFYWVTSLGEDLPHIIEIRRDWAASSLWEAMPGEAHHSMTGEPGGLWRHRGRPPQAIVGVGPAAMGWGPAAGYVRQQDSFDERAAFVFEGIGDDEVIGDFEDSFSAATAGAAGDEIDRLDLGLGSPRHALLLATSAGGHSEHYQPMVEDHAARTPGAGPTDQPRVRADMVYFETPDEGAVFSVGSINWILNLPYNGYRNNVSRITGNVLNRFVS